MIARAAAENVPNSREHEVVAVLRPEEIELAPTRNALQSVYMAEGAVEEILFGGALERMRVRLGDGVASAHVVRADDGADGAYLEVTRTQHEQRVFPLAPGQEVVIGVRRLHVLPTPLSSFTVCATTEAQAQSLSRQPLLVELATRMKTRVALRVEPTLGCEPGADAGSEASFTGAAVIAAQPGVVHCVEWLLRHGAEEVLLLPPNALPPERVLIHWADEAARRATLAVSASMLRHLSAEAVYVGILPEGAAMDAQRPLGMRALLDARSEAQAVHGLEMRTELRFGDVAQELARRLGEAGEQLLILGIDVATELASRFGTLLAAPTRPLLIVYQPFDAARRT